MSIAEQVEGENAVSNYPHPEAVRNSQEISPAELCRVASFVTTIQDWCHERADRVSDCYLTFDSAEVRVVLVARSVKYPFDLGDEFSKLTRQILLAGWPLHDLVLGASTQDELTAFVDFRRAMHLFRGVPNG